MALVSPHFSSPTFTNKLANGTVMVYIAHATPPWTGAVVGTNSDQTLIFTAAHCIQLPQLPSEIIEANLRVMFNGDPTEYHADICLCRKESEILILRVNRKTDSKYKFKFAPGVEHELRRFQPVVTFAHPHGFLYQSADGTICSEEFEEAAIGYDEKMLFFNHRMDLPKGCSGASIFNESGHIIGLQSGEYVDTVNVMGAGPFETLIEKRKGELKKASKVKQATMKRGSVSLADEIRNLNDQLGKVTVSFSEGSCTRQDIVPVNIPSSSMRYAVHVKYLDRIFRTRVFNGSARPLDKLLEDKYIGGSSAGASSSSGS